MKRSVLFLNENPLPKIFTRGTISGKELRLRAAVEFIDKVHAIGLPGRAVESTDKSKGKLEKKIFVHLTPKWPYYLSPIILFIYGFYYAWKLKPEIIEAESPILSGPVVILLGKLFHRPVLVEVRASYDQLIKLKLTFIPLKLKKMMLDMVQKIVFRNADVIVANSKTYQQQIKKLGFESVVINPGLQYPPKTISTKKHKKIIGYLGRLVPEKGVDYLLRACKLIETDLIKGGWSIDIAGDGSERENLKQLADDLFGNSKLKVKFLGFVNNYQALARFSVLVNPSLSCPPLDMVNVEAAYMQVPVVCFGDEKIPETVLQGKSGYKVKSIRINSLAEAIKRVTNFDLGNLDFEEVVKNYKFDNQQKRLKDIYNRYIFL